MRVNVSSMENRHNDGPKLLCSNLSKYDCFILSRTLGGKLSQNEKRHGLGDLNDTREKYREQEAPFHSRIGSEETGPRLRVGPNRTQKIIVRKAEVNTIMQVSSKFGYPISHLVANYIHMRWDPQKFNHSTPDQRSNKNVSYFKCKIGFHRTSQTICKTRQCRQRRISHNQYSAHTRMARIRDCPKNTLRKNSGHTDVIYVVEF